MTIISALITTLFHTAYISIILKIFKVEFNDSTKKKLVVFAFVVFVFVYLVSTFEFNQAIGEMFGEV